MTISWQPTLSALQAAISGIPSIYVTNPGSGFDAPATVAISAPGPGGVQAEATARMGIGAVSVFAGGQNYRTVPNVVLIGGGGSGASCTAVLTPFTVQGVKVTAAGTGYTSPPSVQFSGGGGTGAAGVAVLSGGVVTRVDLVSGGSGYTSAPTVSLSGGGGIGAVVQPTMGSLTGSISSLTGVGGGSYATPPTVTRTGGTNAILAAIINGSVPTGTSSITMSVAVDITYPGSPQPFGYSASSTPIVTIDPPDLPGGTQAIANALVPAAPASSGTFLITVTSGGSGYSYPPGVTIQPPDVPGPGADTALAVASILGDLNAPGGIRLIDGGQGYSSGALTFTPSTGSPTGSAVVDNNTVTSLQIISGGTGYSSPPQVNFVGGSPSQSASATATPTPVGVASVNMTAPGSGYTDPSGMTVVFLGGGGNGALGKVLVNDTTVASVTVNTPGTGYASPPIVAIEGGYGIGAQATSSLEVVGFDVTDGGYLYSIDPFPTVTVTPSDGAGGGCTAVAGLAPALLNFDFFSLIEATAIATELAGIGAAYDAGIVIPVAKRAVAYIAPTLVNFFEVDKATRFAASVSGWFSWPATWSVAPSGDPALVMMRTNEFSRALIAFAISGGIVDQFIPNTWQLLYDLAVPAYSYYLVSKQEATVAATSPYEDSSPLSVQLSALIVTAAELTNYLNTP